MRNVSTSDTSGTSSPSPASSIDIVERYTAEQPKHGYPSMKTHWTHPHLVATLAMFWFAAALGGCGWLGIPWGDRDETLKWDPDSLFEHARVNNGDWKRSRELYHKLESAIRFGRMPTGFDGSPTRIQRGRKPSGDPSG